LFKHKFEILSGKQWCEHGLGCKTGHNKGLVLRETCVLAIYATNVKNRMRPLDCIFEIDGLDHSGCGLSEIMSIVVMDCIALCLDHDR